MKAPTSFGEVMSDLRELYQETILGHYKKPRNFRALESPCQHAEGYNPLCGDKVTVYLKMDKDRVVDVAFQGSGCAISTASASMMTESLKGKTRQETEAIFKHFQNLVTGQDGTDDETLGKLAVFAGVREFPARVKCASLAWHTFQAAMKNESTPVSTE